MTNTVGTLPTPILDILNSPERLATVEEISAAVPGPDADFLPLVQIAASTFRCPIAIVSLLGPQTQMFQARVGATQTTAPTADSFCVHALAQAPSTSLVVPDAAADERFSTKPHVAQQPFVRFYAGVPIMVAGHPVGTICVMDVEPRDAATDVELAQLASLATLAGSLFSMKDEARNRAIKAASLSREERRHAMALEAANVGSWLWDINSGMVSGNDAMMRMLGLPQNGATSARQVFAAIHADDRTLALDRLREAMKLDEEYDSVFRSASTGRWLMGRGRVHERDKNGAASVFLGVNIDVTEAQSSNQRTRLLLRELNHRVKNTLAMLQSLARQTLRTTSDPKEFMTAFAGRLQAISEAHGLLSDHEWGTIRLNALLSKQLGPSVTDYPRQIEIHKDEIELGPDQAVGLGLVLHELATNATKFGSLSVPDGKVVIVARSVQEDGKPVLHMTWTEVGGPEIATRPERRGFGSILIERSLDKILGSRVTVEFLPAGVTAIIKMPLTYSM
ncbi:GAF domain-containing protein [Rhizobium sp. CFBP 8762]|uniref:sensor histidine kinase n=1 Tax=Rhizobium sp. CFBP 8762 TaxID=2775279 RepID=UPI00177E01FD|nr:HWE histidine kinase domain-containing protein [Rhizobium sp. CFBP 8762]MBD8556576.1 GAF domain-containing protein [Rhizobium sp. CFBP 8762]